MYSSTTFFYLTFFIGLIKTAFLNNFLFLGSTFSTSVIYVLGSRIQKLTDVKIDDPGTVRSLAEKTAMVRAARQLLSAITKVLILADRVVIKQLITAKEKVLEAAHYNFCLLLGFLGVVQQYVLLGTRGLQI